MKLIKFGLPILLLLSLLPSGRGNTQAAHVQIAQAAQGQTRPPRALIAPRGGQPFFVIGANYEGATDRAWAMWEDEKFDVDLIDEDFARARSVGINTLRLFVQRPLRDDIQAGDFAKLDAVVQLARRHSLLIILTFTDWAEPDLARAGRLNARIAEHLANEPAILAYDVKNEPQFTDIAGAIYPSTTLTVPLQSAEIILQYGERISRGDIAEYRRSNEGKAIVQMRMTDDQAYMLGNYYKLYIEFLNDGATWVSEHAGTTTIDYMASPDSVEWQPLIAGIDGTLGAWVSLQLDPVRRSDPGRPITAGYSNMVLARMPSNSALTFHSIHRFTGHGSSGLNATFRVLDGIQRAFPGQPVLLEEFGYPGQVKSSNGGVTGYDPRTTANLETAVWAYLYANGFAGGAKWMLNNFSEGYDPAQNTYGLFDDNNRPKHTAYALRQMADLFSRTAPGSLSNVTSAANSASSYSYTAKGATIIGGQVYTSTSLIYSSPAPAQLVTTMMTGTLSIFSTDAATVTINLSATFGLPASEYARITLLGLDPQGQPWTPPVPALEGDWLRVRLQPFYKYRIVAVPRAVARAEPQLDPDTVYFPQTGHNLSGEFLRYWQTYGGLSIFGYPVTEAFIEGGRSVQYFERNRFELHPQNSPPYNVLLGRLGADMTVGRAFSKVEPFVSSTGHRYFPETGYGVHNAFLGYWERSGGLAQFGYPLSDEVKERSLTDGKEYTVQYFERARMEYHPEYKGTDAEVLLGLLGVNALQGKGWLP